jgi:hypothetical protein
MHPEQTRVMPDNGLKVECRDYVTIRTQSLRPRGSLGRAAGRYIARQEFKKFKKA